MTTLRKNTPTQVGTPNPHSPKAVRARDLIWGRPVFKAPALPNPRTIFDPLPFTANRITQMVSDEAAE